MTTKPIPINHGNRNPRRLLFKPFSNNTDELTIQARNNNVNITYELSSRKITLKIHINRLISERYKKKTENVKIKYNLLYKYYNTFIQIMYISKYLLQIILKTVVTQILLF